MLEVKDLHVSYGGIRALRGVDIEVPDGKIVTLIGANGAGKSTLLRTISGLVKAESGSITYNGKEILGMSINKILELGIAQVPEGRRVLPYSRTCASAPTSAGTGTASRRTSTGCMSSSRACRSAPGRWRAHSPAANSRCWPSAAP